MLPKPIYESLPFIYMAAGAAAIVSLDHLLGQICGFMLILVGLVVYRLRSRYRHRKIGRTAVEKTSRRPKSNGEPVSQRKTKIRQDFESGEHSYEQGDYAAALKWYRRAAEQGYALAQANLGSMYFDGQGVPQDFQEALKWYRKAADQGLASAQFNLGVLYEQHRRAPQDVQEALLWYQKAASQGYAAAQVNLGSMYAEGQGGAPVDFQQALKWYRQAAEQGYAPGCFNLGAIYAEGQGGIEQDLVMAYVWFSRAVVLGDEDALAAQKQVGAQLTAAQRNQAQELLRKPITQRPVQDFYK